MACFELKTDTRQDQGSPSGDIPMATNVQDRNWQVSKHLGDCLVEMFERQLWTDVVFQCKDQDIDDASDRLKAHKIVLAARSPVFEAMLFGPLADKGTDIVLDNVDSEIFHLFLKFLYCDNVKLTECSAQQVMELAHMYQVETLVHFCANFLCQFIRPDNACDILERALCYGEKQLQDDACKVIDLNADAVLNSDAFLQCSEKCLGYILKGNTFHVKETVIFKKAVAWALRKCTVTDIKDETKRGRLIRETLGKAFYYIRVPTMSLSEFLTLFRGKGFFSADEQMDILERISNRLSQAPLTNCPDIRSPCSDMVTLSWETDPEYSTYFSWGQVTCSISVEVSVPTSIKELKVSETDTFLTPPDRYYIQGERLQSINNYRGLAFVHVNRRADTSYSDCKDVEYIDMPKGITDGLQLSGTLSCRQIDFSSEFRFTKAGSRLITLTHPLPLSVTKQRYEIGITLRPVPGTILRPLNFKGASTSRSKSGQIKVSIYTKQPRLLEEIRFETESGRNK